MTEELFSEEFLKKQPLLIVLSGPSGVGKDAVIISLQERKYPIHFVVTAASRPPRAGEIHGVDYFFVTEQEFEEMIAHDELIEHSLVYDVYKGVPKSQVSEAMASGKDVIMRLDVQGAAKVRSIFPEAILLFLIPANDEEWFERWRARDTETPEEIALRVETARVELECLDDFDYVVVNPHNQLDKAVDSVISIIEAEHMRVQQREIDL
jgi:guanylate kinase